MPLSLPLRKPLRLRTPLILASAAVVLVAGLLAWNAQSDRDAAPALLVEQAAMHREWARPVDPTFNLFQMSPTLYRSALPTAADTPRVEALGVRTVLSFIKDDDTLWMKDPEVRLMSQPMHADRVTDDEVLQALRTILLAQHEGPVLIHCKHGNNRTGLVAAMYRVVVQGWRREAAVDEMRNNGFGQDDDMEEAVAYVAHADTKAIREALVMGKPCAHSLSFCSLKAML